MQAHCKTGSLTVMKSELQNTPKVRSNHQRLQEQKIIVHEVPSKSHTCHNISKVPVLLAFKKVWVYRTNVSGKSHNNIESKVRK